MKPDSFNMIWMHLQHFCGMLSRQMAFIWLVGRSRHGAQSGARGDGAMSDEALREWLVPLSEAADRWKDEYGIVALYLNDVAAGARLEIPAWEAKDAVECVASGLRHFLQELWHLNLVRPVMAVYALTEAVPEATANRLRRLTWDDEWHRGDFALREASSPERANKLLHMLMGDTMGELDAAVREDKVGIPEVRMAFERRLTELETGTQMADQAEQRLAKAILEEIDAARRAGRTPSLADALTSWVTAEEPSK